MLRFTNIIFREKDPMDPCWGLSTYQNDIIPLSERTNLSYLTQGLIGETYFYNNNARLSLIVTASPQSYFIKYSYYNTGYAGGMLSKIEVFDGSPDDDGTTKFAEVSYTYVDYSTVYDQVGYPGDLAQVKVSELLTDGVTWEHKYTQYRGYDYEYDGYYQLKSVFEADAIERVMQENPEITSPEVLMQRYDWENLSSGNSVGSYASRSFVYYNYDEYTGSNIYTSWGYENLQSKYGGNDRSEVPVYPYLGALVQEL
jgi:hypothetical protein